MPPAIGKVLEPSAPAVASGSPPTIRRRREDDFGGHAVDISRFFTGPLPGSSSV
jgi:hypothetical protein